ncbi:hypothetical protein B0H14DRAFT_3518983 [Mycena olivaceomarginata]|nr:hypothetical protein B0H14DRAFT_3518983 [Mycena olivaceomarginata]
MSENDSNALASDSEQDQSNVSIPWRHTEFVLTPRYAFKFPIFKADTDTPKFEPHPFWTAMSSKAGRPLAKLACICRSTEHNYTEEEATAALKKGLRPFMHSANLLPRDITVAFYGLRYLIDTVAGSDSKWHIFPLPKDKNIPTYHPESVPPKASSRQELPTNDQMDNTPP